MLVDVANSNYGYVCPTLAAALHISAVEPIHSDILEKIILARFDWLTRRILFVTEQLNDD